MIGFKKKVKTEETPKIGTPVQTKRKDILKTILKVFVGMFIVVFVLSSILFGYIFFIRRDRTINKVVTTDTVNDNTISKAEAERRNLENVLQTPKDIKDLTHDTNVTISQDTSQDGFVVAKAYEITKDLKLSKQVILDSYAKKDSFAPIFYFKLDTLTDNNPDITALSSLIATEVSSNNYKIIYLDTSFTYIKDFNILIANLKNTLNAKSIKLGLYLYPKWGNEVDYNNFLQVTNQYHKNTKLADIVNSVDEVIIELYGYSNEYSILPANIAPVDWAKSVVAFTAQEVTSKNKVYFEINNNYFVWPQREFSDTPNNNYAVLDLQAEILNQNQFDAKNYIQSSTNVLGNTLETMKTLEVSGKKYISVSPTQNNIDSLISLIASYGFPGYIIK
ncbi:MAG: hypothetical protein ACMG57_03765 [Candidatus Dojkabacteria bacterium]